MSRTKKGKLGGGDTAWEEKKGQKYESSEVARRRSREGVGEGVGEDVGSSYLVQVRLAEITEELCKDVARGETQCHQQVH